MIHRTIVWAGTFAVIFAGAPAAAQTATGAVVGVPRNHPAAQTSKPRIAGIAPAPQTIPAQNSTVFAAGNSAGLGLGTASPAAPQVAAFYYLPTVVLTDGRVFARFNGRYEEVLRRCPVTSGPLPPGFSVATCWVVDGAGRYQVIQRR